MLEILEDRHGAISGSVALLSESGGELAIEASTGLSGEIARRTRYKVGEGIIGRVVETGKPVVVPQVSQEPLFLDRTGVVRRSRSEMTFICVPVVVNDRMAGAMGVTLPYRRERVYDQEVKYLGIVGSMIGQRLLEENTQLRQELRERYDLSNIVGNSRAMQQVYEQVAQVAGSPTTVLIRGESGTGKELVAHAIHYNSPRADKPFIKVSCGALPEGLIESELFGYEPGAFTDARAQKKGRFELAHGGTLFLDEVGELSRSTQVKLLRVLQEREFERLGGVKPIKVDVRLVAATNKDLEASVQQAEFREDLYYRLNVFSRTCAASRPRRSTC